MNRSKQHPTSPSKTRLAWQRTRAEMEAAGSRFTRHGVRGYRRWFRFLRPYLERLLLASGLYALGVRHALDIRLREVEFEFKQLPAAFDGYTILHLSDLHLDNLEGIAERAEELCKGLDVDLCVITGDIQGRHHWDPAPVVEQMRSLLQAVNAQDGVTAILGNHDSYRIVAPLEELGVRFLINETTELRRADARFFLTGTDDVCTFYSAAAQEALEAVPDGFAIALVHSPEMADIAASAGYALYLTGHTHGGQICLLKDKPIVTFMDGFRRLAVGAWSYGDMQGYTSRGVGVARLAVRFNSRGEVTVVRLRRTQ